MLNSGFAAALGDGGVEEPDDTSAALRPSPGNGGRRPTPGMGARCPACPCLDGELGGLRGADRTGKARNLDLEGEKAGL